MVMTCNFHTSTTGGMGRAATFYKRFASMAAEKRDVSYAVTLNWI